MTVFHSATAGRCLCICRSGLSSWSTIGSRWSNAPKPVRFSTWFFLFEGATNLVVAGLFGVFVRSGQGDASGAEHCAAAAAEASGGQSVCPPCLSGCVLALHPAERD